MLRFVLRRLMVSLLLLLGLASAVFVVVHALPGDPVALALGAEIDSATIATLRRQLGLDRPLVVQYSSWLGSSLRGDFGTSFVSNRPVAEMVRETLPNTLLLASLALVLRFGLGVAAGTLAALRHGRVADRAIVIAALVVYSMPTFWIGVVLQLVFAYGLGWLPADGMRDLDAARLSPPARAGDLVRHLVLPATVLALAGVASTARYMRASLLETLSQDYVRAARARGLGDRVVVLRHAFRNALPPIATLLGLSLPAVVGGSIVVETIFSWPGMGRLALLAVSARDYPVLLATTLLSGALVVLGSLLADVACSLLDPRTRSA